MHPFGASHWLTHEWSTSNVNCLSRPPASQSTPSFPSPAPRAKRKLAAAAIMNLRVAGLITSPRASWSGSLSLHSASLFVIRTSALAAQRPLPLPISSRRVSAVTDRFSRGFPFIYRYRVWEVQSSLLRPTTAASKLGRPSHAFLPLSPPPLPLPLPLQVAPSPAPLPPPQPLSLFPLLPVLWPRRPEPWIRICAWPRKRKSFATRILVVSSLFHFSFAWSSFFSLYLRFRPLNNLI